MRGEFLYVGSKLLDAARRLALTWMPLGQDMDPGMIWELQPFPQSTTVMFYKIRNVERNEFLYVGSKLLEGTRRYALTWTGNPNQDPAFMWELLPGKISGIEIRNCHENEFLAIGRDTLDDKRRYAFTSSERYGSMSTWDIKMIE